MPNNTPEYNRELLTVPYYRDQAVQYANYWAYRRNPNYYSFDQIGGDCTNFVSQALFYANGVMNFTPTYGWYYISLDDRSPSWTGVTYLYNFLTTNKGPGPFGHEVPLSQVEPGDIIQMAIKDPDEFGHTVIVTRLLTDYPDPDTIWVAAHDKDANCRPVSTYDYHMIRAIHIDGVRYLSAGTDIPQQQPVPQPRPQRPQQPIPEAAPETGGTPATPAAAVPAFLAAAYEGEPPAVG